MVVSKNPRAAVSASLSIVMLAAPATAQDATTPLDPIVVTGERRERALTDTFVGTSILERDRIARDEQSQKTVNDVVTTTPNVFVEGRSELPSIRGLQGGGAGGLASAGLTGALPRLSYVIDGVTRPAVLPNSSGSSLWDVDQIEVLRGPQSLLRGRTAYAGAIIIDTADPSFDFEAAAQAGTEWDDFHGLNTILNGMVSGPISDAVAGRLTLEYSQGDDPRIARGTDPTQDLDYVTEFDNLRLRGKLLGVFDTSAGVLTLNGLTEYQKGQTPQTRNTVSTSTVTGRPLSDRILADADRNARSFDTETAVFSLDAGLDTAFGTFGSVTSYLTDDYESVAAQIFDSPFDVDEAIFTQDFLFSFGPESRVLGGDLSGLVGVNYERRTQDVSTSVPTPLGEIAYVSDVTTQSTSIYTDLRYGITDRTTIFGGARLLRFEDDREQVSRAPFPLRGSTARTSSTEDVFLPMLGVAYYFSEDTVLSASVRRGFNPGGAAINLFSGVPYDFESEKVTTAEVTLRNTTPDGDLSVGATAFYNWFEDPQVFGESQPGNRFSLQVVNQRRAISYGLELDATWQATEALRLDAALGLLQTEITQAQQNNPQLDGNRFGQDPPVGVSLGAVYALSKFVTLDARATYRGQSYNDFNNISADRVGDYWIVDIGATAEYRGYVLRAYVDNLFNETGVTRFVGGRAFADVTDPLTIGATLTKTW